MKVHFNEIHLNKHRKNKYTCPHTNLLCRLFSANRLHWEKTRRLEVIRVHEIDWWLNKWQCMQVCYEPFLLAWGFSQAAKRNIEHRANTINEIYGKCPEKQADFSYTNLFRWPWSLDGLHPDEEEFTTSSILMRWILNVWRNASLDSSYEPFRLAWGFLQAESREQRKCAIPLNEIDNWTHVRKYKP